MKTTKTIIVDERAGLEVEGMVVVAVSSRGERGKESPCWANTPDHVVDGCHAQGTLGCRYGVNASSLPPPPCRGGEDGHRADKREKTLITAGKEDTGNE